MGDPNVLVVWVTPIYAPPNAVQASNHQARAVTELVAASRHQRRSRKCMCWAIVGFMLLMIILVIVLKFGTKSVG